MCTHTSICVHTQTNEGMSLDDNAPQAPGLSNKTPSGAKHGKPPSVIGKRGIQDAPQDNIGYGCCPSLPELKGKKTLLLKTQDLEEWSWIWFRSLLPEHQLP